MKALRLVMGDQLTHKLSALQEINTKTDVIVMLELLLLEIQYIKHHKRKLH